MDIKLDIKPEDVEQAVKDAIIKSSIGKMIEKKVAEATNYYKLDKAVDDVLRFIVAERARMLIHEDAALKERIKARLVEKLDDTFIEAIASKIARAIERDY